LRFIAGEHEGANWRNGFPDPAKDKPKKAKNFGKPKKPDELKK